MFDLLCSKASQSLQRPGKIRHVSSSHVLQYMTCTCMMMYCYITVISVTCYKVLIESEQVNQRRFESEQVNQRRPHLLARLPACSGVACWTGVRRLRRSCVGAAGCGSAAAPSGSSAAAWQRTTAGRAPARTQGDTDSDQESLIQASLITYLCVTWAVLVTREALQHASALCMMENPCCGNMTPYSLMHCSSL